MKVPSLKLLAVPALCLFANSAFALVDGNVMIGKRWYQLKANGTTTGVSSQEVSLAAHIDPIPLVPVSFGLRLDYDTLKKEDLGAGVDSGTVVRPGIDVTAWVPMVPIVTPYVRIEVPIAAKVDIKGSSGVGNTSGDLTGYELAVGVKYPVIPLVKLMAEYGLSNEKFKETSVPTGATKTTYDMNSNAFLVGVEVGI